MLSIMSLFANSPIKYCVFHRLVLIFIFWDKKKGNETFTQRILPYSGYMQQNTKKNKYYVKQNVHITTTN